MISSPPNASECSDNKSPLNVSLEVCDCIWTYSTYVCIKLNNVFVGMYVDTCVDSVVQGALYQLVHVFTVEPLYDRHAP